MTELTSDAAPFVLGTSTGRILKSIFFIFTARLYCHLLFFLQIDHFPTTILTVIGKNFFTSLIDYKKFFFVSTKVQNSEIMMVYNQIIYLMTVSTKLFGTFLAT